MIQIKSVALAAIFLVLAQNSSTANEVLTEGVTIVYRPLDLDIKDAVAISPRRVDQLIRLINGITGKDKDSAFFGSLRKIAGKRPKVESNADSGKGGRIAVEPRRPASGRFGNGKKPRTQPRKIRPNKPVRKSPVIKVHYYDPEGRRKPPPVIALHYYGEEGTSPDYVPLPWETYGKRRIDELDNLPQDPPAQIATAAPAQGSTAAPAQGATAAPAEGATAAPAEGATAAPAEGATAAPAQGATAAPAQGATAAPKPEEKIVQVLTDELNDAPAGQAVAPAPAGQAVAPAPAGQAVAPAQGATVAPNLGEIAAVAAGQPAAPQVGANPAVQVNAVAGQPAAPQVLAIPAVQSNAVAEEPAAPQAGVTQAPLPIPQARSAVWPSFNDYGGPNPYRRRLVRPNPYRRPHSYQWQYQNQNPNPYYGVDY